jgi:hypothetical protein
MTDLVRLSAIALVGLVGCADSSAEDFVVRTDSAGVELIRSERPDSDGEILQVAAPTMDLTESGHEFYRVRDMVQVDSLLVVAEPTQVRAFLPDGSEEWVFGREGDGPQEFQRISDLEVRGDSIIVFDYWRRRVSVLTRAGEWGRGFTLRTPLLGPDLVLTQIGFAVSATSAGIMDPDGPTGFVRTPSLIVQVGWDGQREDTIARLAGTESVRIPGPNGIIDQLPVFGHLSLLVTDGSGRLARIDGEFLGYESLGSEGDVVARSSGALSTELPDSLLEAEWDAREEILGSAAVRELRESTPTPDSRPMASDAKSDDRGRVWIREHYGEFRNRVGPGPQVWQVFGEGGAWLGYVEVPSDFQILDLMGDRVLGVFRDSLDVEHPQVRSLVTSNEPE